MEARGDFQLRAKLTSTLRLLCEFAPFVSDFCDFEGVRSPRSSLCEEKLKIRSLYCLFGFLASSLCILVTNVLL